MGATEQAILAAVTANGMTVIDNAAREPEIAELAVCFVVWVQKSPEIRQDAS